jgi:Flp pilus assembly protein TadD
MKITGWVLAVSVAATPAIAGADPFDKPHKLLGQGVVLVVAGDWPQAEKKIREALRLNPSLAEGHYNLAVALRNQGRFDEAIVEYHTALGGFVREEDRAKALYGVGLAREAKGDKNAWSEYLAWAVPLKDEQNAVQIAEQHNDEMHGVKVPGTQKASRPQNIE